MTRRDILINRMDELEGQGLNCTNCPGTCCTFEANSMMVSPLEALDLMLYLKKNKLDTLELKTKLLETKSKFRLDHELGNGKKSYLRKTYTCTFFNHGELGCPLPREVKPYGCLAFNAHHSELKAQEFCFSEKDLLQKRDDKFPKEENRNKELKNKFNLIWNKSPLPTALLDLWDKTMSDEDLLLN